MRGQQETRKQAYSPPNAYSSRFGSGCICSTKTVVSWAALSCAAAPAGLPVPFHAHGGGGGGGGNSSSVSASPSLVDSLSSSLCN